MESFSKDEVMDNASSPTSSSDAIATATATATATAVSDHVMGITTKGEDEPVSDSTPLSGPLFQEGEKVLAYFKLVLYEAKILRVDLRDNDWKYLVHYHGWNNNWDEWVGIDRLMQNTEENRQQLQYRKKGDEMENNAKAATKQKTSGGAKGRKRKTGSAQKDKGMPSSEKPITISIPPALKKQLVDDWESVAQSDKLLKLPRSPNVDKILSIYPEYRLTKETRLAGSVGEFVNGLRTYFDQALPVMLLYKNERQQYEEEVTNKMAPSAVYGAEHLLRLFVKLPEMLNNAGIEEKLLTQFQQNVADFVKFLQKNHGSFFLGPQQQPAEQLVSGEKREE